MQNQQEEIYSVIFMNDLSLAISIETWQTVSFGHDVLTEQIVLPGEIIIMPSSTGEWLINTYIYNDKIKEQWKNAGYTTVGFDICKFRCKPAIDKQYSWMFHDDFKIVYENGNAILSKINN